MRFEEALIEYRKGKKIRRHCWLFILAHHQHYNEATPLLHNAVMADDWEVIEEPKPPKLLAPALCRSSLGVYFLSSSLFSSEANARCVCGDDVKWPAIPDANGCYSVPQE